MRKKEIWAPRRVPRRGSEKGVSRRCLERPLGEYNPLGVRPIVAELSLESYKKCFLNLLNFTRNVLELDLSAGAFGNFACSCAPSGKKRAHKLKKNPRDTGRVSLGHPAGQTGVYRPVSRGLPVIYYRKTDRKGHFCRDTGRVSQGHPAIQEVFR